MTQAANQNAVDIDTRENGGDQVGNCQRQCGKQRVQ